jgi:hypothetical protein
MHYLNPPLPLFRCRRRRRRDPRQYPLDGAFLHSFPAIDANHIQDRRMPRSFIARLLSITEGLRLSGD